MKIIVLIIACFMASCATAPPIRVVSVDTPTKISTDAEKSKLISDLEKKLDEATKSGDEVARLTALTTLLKTKTQIAEQDVVDLKREGTQAKKDLKAAKDQAFIDAATMKLHLFAMFMGTLMLGAIFVGVFQPQLKTWCIRIGIAAAILASLALAIVKILPYLWIIGGVLIVIAIVGYLLWNRMSDKTRLQLVTVVDKVKGEIPDYKNKLGDLIDHDVDRFIDQSREHLGLKPKTTGNTGEQK